MMARRTYLTKHSIAEKEGSGFGSAIKGIEREAELINEVLTGPIGEVSKAPESILQGLTSMKITPQVKTFLKATIATLVPLFSNITQASANDTQMLDKMYDSFSDLSKDMNQTKLKVKSLTEAAAATRKQHADCRSSEDGILLDKTTCDAASGRLAKKAMVHLQEVQSHQGVSKSSLCGVSVQSLAKVDSIKSGRDKAHALADASEVFLEAEANRSAKASECIEIANNHSSKKAECNGKQEALESAVCEEGRVAKEGCEVYASIYATRLQDYKAVTESVSLRMADRATEWLHLKRVLCILESLMAAKSDGELEAKGKLHTRIEECYKNPFPNPGLMITAKTAPAQDGCPSVPVLPCTDAFIIKEYSSLPAGAGPAACKNGCAPTTMTTTEI